MAILNGQDAKAIASKLKAQVVTRRKAHDLALVFHEGLVVAKFGLRRGRKDLGHDHIMADLFVSPRNARRLASCEMSQREWLRLMEEKGHIGADPQALEE